MRNSSQYVQKSLFDMPDVPKVVNVASVPQRSPFRYAGGKTWLVPRIRTWLRSLLSKPKLLLEPFAGGAIVGLTVAFEDLADRVLLVELDEDVASVWQTILGADNEWLANQILDFELTEENVRREIKMNCRSSRKRAFKTILRNRTLHGGILAAGSSLVRFGENGKGLRSRWYPETLARRIRTIAAVRDKIEFRQFDGIEAIREYAAVDEAAFFIDPPYTAAGKKAGRRLYTHHQLDHELLFSVTASVAGDFVMTYDHADDVETLAQTHGLQTCTVAMKNTHHATMSELLIGRDLQWV